MNICEICWSSLKLEKVRSEKVANFFEDINELAKNNLLKDFFFKTEP